MTSIWAVLELMALEFELELRQRRLLLINSVVDLRRTYDCCEVLEFVAVLCVSLGPDNHY